MEKDIICLLQIALKYDQIMIEPIIIRSYDSALTAGMGTAHLSRCCGNWFTKRF